MTLETIKVIVKRFCMRCYYEWEQAVTRDELRKLAGNLPVSSCPKCGSPS